MKEYIITNKKKKKNQQLLCFSFAAYAKTLIAALRSSGVEIARGLTPKEFSSIETLLGFTFPPDLRALLREGLPVSPGFPNWRLASPRLLLRHRQLKDSISDSDSDSGSGSDSDLASPLVPIFCEFYVASMPCEAGNPIFGVSRDGEVTLASFDLAGFFRGLAEPVWAAKEARRIEFWSDLADLNCQGRSQGLKAKKVKSIVGECMERVSRRLREGGWGEDDVREMTTPMDGCDQTSSMDDTWQCDYGDTWQCEERLATVLLRAGWSSDDVAYSLGIQSLNDHDDFVVFY